MNAKRKGTAREYRSMRLLETVGYSVFCMAGSHGLVDLIGVSPTDIVFVQCKSRDFLYDAEREVLEAFKTLANCRKLCHRWKDGQRLPDAVELP